ncbi:MAG: hypothetical protein KJO07_06465 [Deltaproteobacteria bacterium]|nr:hypothetical protein [Deltaproteobacteria bacterium]
MGFEFSRFNASGQCEHTAEDGHVWLVGNAEYMARLRELVPTGLHSPTVYVKLSFRGRLSPPGRYGHLDMWKRQVTIVELEHAELASHCPAPTGVTSRWGLDDRIRYVAGGLEPIADDRVIADGLPELLKHVQFERMTIVSHPGPGETAELAEKRAQALLESFRNGGVTLPIAVRVGARSQPFIEFEAFGPDDD